MSHGDDLTARAGATPDGLDPLSASEGAEHPGVGDESVDEWIAAQAASDAPPRDRSGADATTPPGGAGATRSPTLAVRLRNVGRAASERAWLLVAGAAAITLIATMDFRPPSKVRVHARDGAELIGEAPLEDVEVQASPQSVVVRAELSRYEATAAELGARPRGGDEDDPTTRRVVLARPVVTTLYGLTATFEQTMRLDGGRHEVDVAVEVTPRVGDAKRGELPPIRLERDVRIVSRRHGSWAWWDRSPVERLVMHEHTTLADATQGISQLTFAVDDQLFVLSLDVTRPSV